MSVPTNEELRAGLAARETAEAAQRQAWIENKDREFQPDVARIEGELADFALVQSQRAGYLAEKREQLTLLAQSGYDVDAAVRCFGELERGLSPRVTQQARDVLAEIHALVPENVIHGTLQRLHAFGKMIHGRAYRANVEQCIFQLEAALSKVGPSKVVGYSPAEVPPEVPPGKKSAVRTKYDVHRTGGDRG